MCGCGITGHRLRYAMGGEDDIGAVRHLVELVDEHRALPLQGRDHGAVVDDFVPHINRRPPAPEGQLDDLDRPVDPGAEAAWRGEKDGQRGPVHAVPQALFRGRGLVRARALL